MANSEIVFIDATYSPEDNKLRLYNNKPVSPTLFERLRRHGFQNEPSQHCFFAAWTPQCEELCLELFGDINCEQTTLAQRAQAKATRFDTLAQDHEQKADPFSKAAQAVQNDNAFKQAEHAFNISQYWHNRAMNVGRHVAIKITPSVVANRIKKLLSDLRHHQNAINHGHILFRLWTNIQSLPSYSQRKHNVDYYVGCMIKTGETSPVGQFDKYRAQQITVDEIITQNIEWANQIAQSVESRRWIAHILNRLSYERRILGDVPRFEGQLTTSVLQIFARTQGALSPQAKRYGDQLSLSSPAILPLHIANDHHLTLTSEEWRDLMQSVGYAVPAPKPSKPPLLNFKAKRIQLLRGEQNIWYTQLAMTKAQFNAILPECRRVETASCKQFRVKICRHIDETDFVGRWVCVYLTDSRDHDIPDSPSIERAFNPNTHSR